MNQVDVRCTIYKVLERDWSAPIKGQAIDFDLDWDEFYTTYVEIDSGRALKYYTQAERVKLISDFCDRLFQAAAEPSSCTEALEDIWLELLTCKWRPAAHSLIELTDEVEKFIRRLPEPPLELPGPLHELHPDYFIGSSKTWASLKVVSHLHGNLVRFIAYRILTLGDKGFVEFVPQQTLTHVGELIRHCVSRFATSKRKSEQSVWYVVRAFLWSFWQRLRVLYAFFHLIEYLRKGVVHGNEGYQWMPNFPIAPNLSLRALTETAASRQKPPNLCGWAFELLRGDPACLGVDFGILFRRYRDVFGTTKPRCTQDSESACDGRYWKRCLRFYRPETSNQSMHDQSRLHDIHDEIKVAWDEESYRSIKGAARAVDVCSENSDCLVYRPASDQTMAISHVWSHGQGGRPEIGINMCLHLRYIALAKSLGCDSYWIDAACVPDDKQLRSEAIDHIKDVFYGSRCAVVIDQDLMTLNAAELTTELQESILVAVLLSDWNMRGWTLLEALRGRRQVGILCQNNQVLQFQEVLKHVCDHGRIDLAIFASLLPHMLPWRHDGAVYGPVMEEIAPNRLPLEVVGSWLSHRPVTRAGDDVQIWSLCLGPETTKITNAVDFWRRQRSVNTGFLMSSAERLSQPGLSWAPKMPSALPLSHKKGGGSIDMFHRPHESMDTETGLVRSDGLWAQWQVSEPDYVEDHPFTLRTSISYLRTMIELRKLRKHLKVQNEFVALLRPVSNVGPSRYHSEEHKPSESASGVLIAVCDSDHRESKKSSVWPRFTSYKWIWRGVYQWPSDVQLPIFTPTHNFWIA